MSKGATRSLAAARLKGSGLIKTVVFDKTIVVPDPGAAIAFASAVLAGLPQANLWIGAALAYFTVQDVGGAGLIAAFTGNFAVGTAPTADATLNNLETNIIPSTAFTAAAGVTPSTRAAPASSGTTNELTLNGFFHDNTDGSLELNGNIIIADASISAQATVRVKGVLHLVMAELGDD